MVRTPCVAVRAWHTLEGLRPPHVNSPNLHSRFNSWAALAVVVVTTGRIFAATHVVDSIAALQVKIRQAEPGDTITVKDGVYTTSAAITIRRAGALDQPIVIAAESIGGVELAGTHGFNVTEPAAHVVISGFKLTHASGRNTIGAGTSHVRFTRNTFRCTGDGAFLSIAGDDAQIDYNEFADKKTAGSMVAVGGTGSQVARRLHIHHNYFHDLAGAGATAEMIRFGLTALCLSTGSGIVEHNLFVRCRGENELISSRASGITYRYNTLLDSPTAQFTLRHGNDCLVYSNTFRNTEGLRIYGDRHQVFSNYFEKNYIAINLGNGSADVPAGGALTGHDRPDDCIIVFNTLVDNRTHYQMSRRTPEGLGATNTTFANNIMLGGNFAAKIEGPYAGAVWSGNLAWNVASTADLPPDGSATEDPLFAAGDDGLMRPKPASVAIASGVGGFSMVIVDIDGQRRPEKMTRGADEPSADPLNARVLTVNDVGPSAK
jgi:poly(beta-D-mannuronate) lyase